MFGVVLLLVFAVTPACSSDTAWRERLLLDFGWKFHLGDKLDLGKEHPPIPMGNSPAAVSFNDASWREVNLPHDWAVELPFDPTADGMRGFKSLGPRFEQHSVGWYRRAFDLPKSAAGRRLWLEFAGVSHSCTVFVNGWLAGRFDFGHAGFWCDITEIANYGGKNVVAVKVDASAHEGKFYDGAGIYRHVWLVSTEPVAVAPDGVFVVSRFKDNRPVGAAEIQIQTTLLNAQPAPKEAAVTWIVLEPSGRTSTVARTTARLAAHSRQTLQQTATVQSPVLWSPESPQLYRLLTMVESSGNMVDRVETEFGIRTIVFDPGRGFLLNGRPYQIKGTCNRQDHAALGVALPDRLHYFRVARLKETGCNAYRPAYHVPAPELLEACDRLGMLVVADLHPIGSDQQTLDRLERVVRRDRNHPSIVAWSLLWCEHCRHYTSASVRVLQTIHALVKRLDPTRPVVLPPSLCEHYGAVSNVFDVCGWHRCLGETNMDTWRKAHPNWPNIGIEQPGTVGTRGVYASDPKRGHLAAYEDNALPYWSLAEAWTSFWGERQWLAGGFVWSGFDFRGEPTPYWWPCINSNCGMLDLCGFPKDSFYYYQAWWSDMHVLRVLTHWNWAEREGQEVDVRILGNAHEVELYLNDRSLGRQKMKKYSHLCWKVKYEPGTLAAIGFRDGRAVGRTKIETTGPPLQVHLRPDKAVINADGEEVSVVTVAVTDARLRVVPGSSNLIRFTIEGPGRILGVGNGDPSCHEPDVFVAQPIVVSRPVRNWRWKKIHDVSKGNVAEVSTKYEDATWAPFNAEAEWGPLAAGQSAMFRADLVVTEQDIAYDTVELWFGRIDDEGWVYVNGNKAGESHAGRIMAGFNVKPYLRPGTNVFAVAVRNSFGPGGINLGAVLRLQDFREPPKWQRSVFNGLAQIIVQGTKRPGEIRLAAHADGLQPAAVTIRSQACTPRPAAD